MSVDNRVEAAGGIQVSQTPDFRSLAFYLPQFHPIAENDREWGKGFTEWTNVARAVPRWKGHYQPHLPADLGYYDLRLPESRAAQAQLAQDYGLGGFVYYHYWFGGRRALERPFEEVLGSGDPSLPFALCWANEPWTRRWDGGNQEIIIPQSYGVDDDLDHWRSLLPALSDQRYIRIGQRPVFLVYRASDLPDPLATTDIWRNESSRLGLPDPYLIRVECGGEPREDPRALGFDAAVEFQPDFAIGWQPTLLGRVKRRAYQKIDYSPNKTMKYEQLIDLSLAKDRPAYRRFPGVCPSWDNSARARRGSVALVGAEPKLFQSWVSRTVARSTLRGDEDLLFVNAWNEWAEGAHLEPDQRFGHQWLEALRSGIQSGLSTRSHMS